jgi:hypothetical protein
VSSQPICCQCGGPRSASSGTRCVLCYRYNASLRKKRKANTLTWDEAVFLSALDGEKVGDYVFIAGEYKFCFPEHANEEDVKKFPWIASRVHFAKTGKYKFFPLDEEPPTS